MISLSTKDKNTDSVGHAFSPKAKDLAAVGDLHFATLDDIKANGVVIPSSHFKRYYERYMGAMIGSGAIFPVSYRRKVYLLRIEATNMKISTPYKKTRKLDITSKVCKVCNSLEIAGICTNPLCKTNKKASV